jgi:hypothetical protein
MRISTWFRVLLVLSCLAAFSPAWAQSINAGTIEGVVKDSTGAVVPNASVEISYPVSGYSREIKSGAAGEFRFANVPFNPYHLVVRATGFAAYTSDVDVRTSVPVTVPVVLQISGSSTTVTVESQASDLIETESTPHTDIDRGLFDKLPLESASSSVSSLVTLASPGAVADSNGLMHGIGDHAENSFSVDGQPNTDQTSKVFSNQIPIDSIQSLEVISGAPPAEYGGKTSLVINVTTRSGMGQTKPTGSLTTSYGSFGTTNSTFNLAVGSQKVGNFVSINGLNTGRFLDPPEFKVIHAKGNEENFFDRFDVAPSSSDSFHLNVGYTRSWFQQPNSFDTQATNQDQRAQIQTFNVSPSWTHLFSNTTLLTAIGYVRHDGFNYYPSGDPFNDLPETLSQNRTLTNAGLRLELSYVKGAHNLKVGTQYQHTLLTENFKLGLTDPTVNSPCVDATGAPVADPSVNDPSQCAAKGYQPNTAANPNASAPFVPLLGCFDLTRGTPSANDACSATTSTLFGFHGHADVKEAAFYIQDAITKGSLTLNLGLRGELYRGLSRDQQLEPRVGAAYNIKRSNTVLRLSYARIMESPFNENLVLSNSTSPVVDAIFGGVSPTPTRAGQRNEFHAGFQQALGRHLVVDADYLWKYTHNGYDFSDLLNTPIFFPIAWHNSKIDGFNIRASIPATHGFTGFIVIGHVNARFFNPQVGGLGADPTAVGVFRIDHDQKLQQTTHVQYQPWKRGPWFALNWRYDSGLVAGAVPFATDTTTRVDLTGLTADQQMQAGLFCGSARPTLTTPLTSCAPNLYGSTLLQIPKPGTENDDHNPPRVRPRNLFDVSVGHDNLFNGDRYKVSLRATVINLTNRVALYNFLSTFSGTHYVTPRNATIELGVHF